LGARAARGFAGILALAALFGTLVTLALLLGVAMNLVHAREIGHPLHTFAIPLVGHLNPLLRQAEELQRRGWRVAFFTRRSIAASPSRIASSQTSA